MILDNIDLFIQLLVMFYLIFSFPSETRKGMKMKYIMYKVKVSDKFCFVED